MADSKIIILISSALEPKLPNLRRIVDRLFKSPSPSLRINIDRDKLLYQIGTTGYKINFAKSCLAKLSDARSKLSLPLQSSQDFLNFLFNLDVFFFVLHGAIDSLAREINIIYKLCLGDGKTYPTSVRDMMKSKHRNETITQLLDQILQDAWYKHFKDIRNVITHRSTLVVEWVITFDNGKVHHIFLPDNPDAASAFTFTKRREVVPYCEDVLEKVAELLEQWYSLLEQKLFV